MQVLFTKNRKTILSLDFNRDKTCSQICSYCYVNNTERIYPAYKRKIKNNYILALRDPLGFAKELNLEYKKYTKSKAKDLVGLNKLPVRIYGSGDYIPSHHKFLKLLNFDFFVISKNLTLPSYQAEVTKLLSLKHLKSLVLSFDEDNLSNYNHSLKFLPHSKVTSAFTGNVDNMEKTINKDKYIFGIAFSTDNTKKGKLMAQTLKEQCPCDSGLLKTPKSCTICSKCWKPKKGFKKSLTAMP